MTTNYVCIYDLTHIHQSDISVCHKCDINIVENAASFIPMVILLHICQEFYFDNYLFGYIIMIRSFYFSPFYIFPLKQKKVLEVTPLGQCISLITRWTFSAIE